MMKATVEVKDRQERDAIRRGLEDPAVRAFVVVMGVLLALPSDGARKRVMQYVMAKFDEESGQS